MRTGEASRPESRRRSNRKIRVTDRRRIHIDDNDSVTASAGDEPSLKPSYVEELEATKAAEQKLTGCSRVLTNCAPSCNAKRTRPANA